MTRVHTAALPALATAYERAASIAAACIRDGVKVRDAAKAQGLLMSPDAKNWGQFIMRLANHMHQAERRRHKPRDARILARLREAGVVR
jgi:hypothetical protein